MKLITLVRHGQASFGADNYDKLSPKGVSQTQWLGQYFRQTHRQVDTLTSGEMSRQQESLRHFFEHYHDLAKDENDKHKTTNAQNLTNTHPIILPNNNNFNEFNHEQVFFRANLGFHDKASFIQFLATQAQPENSFTELFNKSLLRWQSGQFDSDYDETWQAFSQRTWQGFEQSIAMTEDNQHAMIFTSGGVIASIIQQVLRLTDAQALDLNWHTANASLHQFRVTEKGIFLVTFNEFGYLYEKGEELVTWK